jgi:hypothetical protein
MILTNHIKSKRVDFPGDCFWHASDREDTNFALCVMSVKFGSVGYYNGMAYLRREISDKAKCLHIAESQYKSINFVYGDNCSYS